MGLEGVAGLEAEGGGTLGGREGGTESGKLSPPLRDFTLETAEITQQNTSGLAGNEYHY